MLRFRTGVDEFPCFSISLEHRCGRCMGEHHDPEYGFRVVSGHETLLADGNSTYDSRVMNSMVAAEGVIMIVSLVMMSCVADKTPLYSDTCSSTYASYSRQCMVRCKIDGEERDGERARRNEASKWRGELSNIKLFLHAKVKQDECERNSVCGM